MTIAAPKHLLWSAAALVLTAAIGGCTPGNDDGASPAGQAATGPTEAGETAGSKVAAHDLRAGECMTDSGTTDAPDIQVLPCTEPHAFEVFATTELPDGDYPGIGEADAQAQEFCRSEFLGFIGVDYDASSLELQYFYPVESEWYDDGGRMVACLVGAAGGDPATGTLRDSRR